MRSILDSSLDFLAWSSSLWSGQVVGLAAADRRGVEMKTIGGKQNEYARIYCRANTSSAQEFLLGAASMDGL
jgi:hypothetical protein